MRQFRRLQGSSLTRLSRINCHGRSWSADSVLSWIMCARERALPYKFGPLRPSLTHGRRGLGSLASLLALHGDQACTLVPRLVRVFTLGWIMGCSSQSQISASPFPRKRSKSWPEGTTSFVRLTLNTVRSAAGLFQINLPC